MVADNLLGFFEHHLADAAVDSRYKYKADKFLRMFGGYNMIGFGDFYQIPPIPPSDSLAIPPLEKKTEHARRALELMWGIVMTASTISLSSPCKSASTIHGVQV